MRRGFTLTELLVVMAVVFLLAVVLSTTVSGVMAHARKTGCVRNIRGQLVGLLAYSADHGKRYYWPAASSSDDRAPALVYPDYVSSLEAFICPATKNRIRPDVIDAKTEKPVDLNNNATDARDARGGHSYEYFGYFQIPPNQMRLEWIGDKFHARKRPGHPFRPDHQTVLILDGDDSGINNFPAGENNHGAAGWHWGFADGHVRWVSTRETRREFVRSGQYPEE
jgi:prepilin-type N-terminal cleavage/methylation domain-containing protein